MLYIAVQGHKIVGQYASLRTAKTWGKKMDADHLYVCELTLSGSRPSLTIHSEWHRSGTYTNFWTRY